VREKYCWLAGGWCWFDMREKYCWLAAAIRVIRTTLLAVEDDLGVVGR